MILTAVRSALRAASGFIHIQSFHRRRALLTNGTVLETLQYSLDSGQEAELYDPTTATFNDYRRSDHAPFER